MNIFELFRHDFIAFILVFIRLSGFMFTAPVYGSQNIPIQLKVAFILFLSFLIFPIIPTPQIPIMTSSSVLILMGIIELAVGMLIGFSAYFFFAAAQLAGHLVDQELGIGLANIFDPITNTQGTLIGQFNFFLAMLIFLAIDGHHYLLGAMVRSFDIIPIFKFTLSEKLSMLISDRMFTEIFVIAIKISAPVVASLMVTTVAMGFLARTVPEMNIFIMGFALRIGVGLGVLAIVIPMTCLYFANRINNIFVDLNGIMRLMAT